MSHSMIIPYTYTGRTKKRFCNVSMFGGISGKTSYWAPMCSYNVGHVLTINLRSSAIQNVIQSTSAGC